MNLVAEAARLIERYPPGRSRSALVPLLHLVQERDGYVTEAGMNEVAGILGITTAQVQSVASFYTMFHLKPKGRHVIGVCHNLACTLNGAEELIASLEEHLGIKCGETTGDGDFTMERAECLAACDLAPMLQIDYQTMHGPLTREGAVQLLESVRLAPPSGRFAPVPGTPSATTPAEGVPGTGQAQVDLGGLAAPGAPESLQ